MFTKEDYVSLETAKILKEKGFNEPCNAWYGINGSEFASIDISNHNHTFPKDSRYSKPTLYEAQKWLRNRYGIAVNVYNILSTCGVSWAYEYNKIEECKSINNRNRASSTYKTYEQALNI